MLMSGELSGLSVLVLDDHFLLADDARRALENAGARVIGPCPDEATAARLIEAQTPDCAVLDVNFGEGPRYALARLLQRKGVPLVFLTGYDREALPAEFAAACCLTKPADFEEVILEVARAAALTSPAAGSTR